MTSSRLVVALVCLFALLNSTAAQRKSRARDLGIPFEGNAGSLNAITDVRGVEVGLTTIISGEGELKVGTGPIRTGVTAILPRGKTSADPGRRFAIPHDRLQAVLKKYGRLVEGR